MGYRELKKRLDQLEMEADIPGRLRRRFEPEAERVRREVARQIAQNPTLLSRLWEAMKASKNPFRPTPELVAAWEETEEYLDSRVTLPDPPDDVLYKTLGGDVFDDVIRKAITQGIFDAIESLGLMKL